MPNRTLKDQNYRFGFNGKEADREGQWGSTEHYDYGFRIYDPKIARFLSVDPLTSSYPWYTPYQFAGNKPIAAIDLDGLEEWFQYSAHLNIGIRVDKSIGPIPLEEANKQGYYTRDQIHHMVFDVSFNAALNEKREQRREKAIARKNFENHKAKASNPIWNFYETSGFSDATDFAKELQKGDVGGAALAAMAFIPLPQFKATKFLKEIAPETKRLINDIGTYEGGRELIIRTNSGRRTDAMQVVDDLLGGLGELEKPMFGKSTTKYPDADKTIVGLESRDGSKGYRIDFDPDKGAHINFYDNRAGIKGAIEFDGTQLQVEMLKEQMNKTFDIK